MTCCLILPLLTARGSSLFMANLNHGYSREFGGLAGLSRWKRIKEEEALT